MSVTLIVTGLLLMCVLFVAWYAVYEEMRDYNKGKCKKCGTALRHFDYDSQGGRGYICPHCKRTVWVSYCFVDKKHTED